MPTHFTPSQDQVSRRRSRCTSRDWRCTWCFKLLGHKQDGRVRLRFGRDHQYDCSLPVSTVCRCCGTLNELLKIS